MSPAALLFDLDGTLIDSEDGIVDSLQHALRAMGQPAMTREAIIPLIGPPLLDTFRTMFGEESLAVQAVAEYKRHYDAAGWHLFRIYDGIEAAVRGLHAHGHRLAVATSKTERFARRIIAELPFGECFANVTGTSEDGRLRYKADLIAEAMRRGGIATGGAVMIGDRRMDIEGARAHGLGSLGVLWGFGDAPELQSAGATRLVQTPADLPAAVAALQGA